MEIMPVGVFFRVDNISLVPNQRDSLRDTVGCDSVLWKGVGGMDIGSTTVSGTPEISCQLLWDDSNAILFQVPRKIESLCSLTWCPNAYSGLFYTSDYPVKCETVLYQTTMNWVFMQRLAVIWAVVRRNFDRLRMQQRIGDKECIQSSSENIPWRTALRRPRSKWDDNIKVYFKEINLTRLSLCGCNCVPWDRGQ